MRYRVSFAALLLGVLLSGFLATANLQSVSAQTATVPDLSKFGYPQVVATADFTPGTATTLTAGNQKVVLPADFLSKPVKFELLEGTAASFTSVLPSGGTVVATFAFRVTDPATSQLVGAFTKPVQWSITDPAIVADSAVYNTTATDPIKVTKNGTAGTLTGTTLAHGFGGAGVGWLVLNGVAATTTTSAPAPAPTSAPTSLPATGQGGLANDSSNLLLALLAGLSVIAIGGGLFLRQYTKHR